jgi:hypothetical protein
VLLGWMSDAASMVLLGDSGRAVRPQRCSLV